MDLYALKQDPRPQFAGQLREVLRTQEQVPADRRRRFPVGRTLGYAAGVALVVGVATVPAVRTSAASFLAMFRQINFVAVPLDEERNGGVFENDAVDLPKLIGENVQILQDPGAPVPAASVAQAGDAAGYDVRVPAYLPAGTAQTAVMTRGALAMRITADSNRLQEVMNVLGITDIDAPVEMHGQVIDVRLSPIVSIAYHVSCDGNCDRDMLLIQAQPPQVQVPGSVDLRALGEIGFRLLGFDAAEARRFAASIDWANTLLVPVPPMATAFRQVSINGRPGMFIEAQVPDPDRRGRRLNVLMWSGSDRIYALHGDVNEQEMTQTAISIR